MNHTNFVKIDTSLTAHEAAKELIARTGNEGPIIMIGLPSFITPPTKEEDPERSESLMSKCTECATPVWSTVVKQEVLKLAPGNSSLLCEKCLKDLLRESQPHRS